jgi:hypothetical protein
LRLAGESRDVICYVVVAGLDPAIHAAVRLQRTGDEVDTPRLSMDTRVKPAYDELKQAGLKEQR